MLRFSRKPRDGDAAVIDAERERIARQAAEAARAIAVQEAKAEDERPTACAQRAALARDGFSDLVRQSLLEGHHHRGREAPS